MSSSRQICRNSEIESRTQKQKNIWIDFSEAQLFKSFICRREVNTDLCFGFKLQCYPQPHVINTWLPGGDTALGGYTIFWRWDLARSHRALDVSYLGSFPYTLLPKCHEMSNSTEPTMMFCQTKYIELCDHRFGLFFTRIWLWDFVVKLKKSLQKSCTRSMVFGQEL